MPKLRTGDEWENMTPEAWVRMIAEECQLPVAKEHYLTVAQVGAYREVIPDAYIDMMAEPYRTRYLRMREGQFPYSPEEIAVMDDSMKEIIMFCHNCWVDAKDSPNGIASYAKRQRADEMLSKGEYHWQDKAEE